MKTKTVLVTMGAGFVLSATAMLGNAAQAQADGKLANEYRICQMLEANPSFATIDAIAAGLIPVVGIKAAADDLVDATTYICPQYYGLVQSYASSRTSYNGINHYTVA